MKQVLLPGMRMPRPEQPHTPPADHWPDMSQMLGSLFVCELPTNAATAAAVDSTPPECAFPPITVLGLGLGPVVNPATLPPEHQEHIRQAQVLAGGKALLACFPAAQGQRVILGAPLEAALLELEQKQKEGQRVVVLADGDPLFFGIGASLVRRLGNQAVRIVPGISSLQEACARLGLPWHDVACVSLHGREDFHALNVALLANTSVCLLTDKKHSPDRLARHLLDRGVDWFDAHIFEHLNTPQEQRHSLSLREVVAGDFCSACTVILQAVRPARRPVLGIPDTALATEGSLMTKAPVRAAALSLLRIDPGHTVWDVGSGSGAVALEAAALAREGCVMAIERSPGRALCIKENRRRFGAANLEIYTGEAPQCLHPLPAPHRVFVGGGLNGDGGEDILAAIARRLTPGGRVVVSCVLLGSLQRALDFFQRAQWSVEITSIQPAVSAPLAGDIHLNAINPVFLVAAQKPLSELPFQAT